MLSPFASLRGNSVRSMWLVVILASAPLGVFEFVLPLYGAALGASATSVGWLFSVFSVTALATRPVVGWLLDRAQSAGHQRSQRSFILLLGLLAYAVALGLFAVAQSVALLAVARLVQGVASATTWLTVTVLLANASAENGRGAAFGRLVSLGAWGSGLGAGWTTLALLLFDGATRKQAQSVLAEAGRISGLPLAALPFPTPILPIVQVYHIVFWGYVGFVLLALIIHVLVARRPPTPAVPPALESAPPAPFILHPSSFILSTWPLLLAAFLRSGAYGITLPVLTLYLDRRFGLGVIGLGLVYAVPGLIYALAPGALGRMADRVGHTRAAVAGLLVSAAVSVLVPLVPSLLLLGALWTLEAVAFSLAGPALSALLTDRTDAGARGRAFALYTLVGGLGAAITPALGGWLYDALGAGPAFWANALLVALSVGALVIPNRRNTEAQRKPFL